MEYIITNGQLYHHGIKGQKWGVRRFQNKDGTLTAAGRKRRNDNSSDTNEKKKTTDQKLKKSSGSFDITDSPIMNAKIDKLSKEESAKLKRMDDRTKKAMLAVGGVAVATLVGVAAYRYFDSTTDRIVKPGQIMQTVHKEAAADRLAPGNPFYATFTKRDNTIYGSPIFSHFKNDTTVTKFFTNNGLKIASEKSGRDVFKELLETDADIKKYCEKPMFKGKSTKDQYRLFNKLLVLVDDDSTTAKNKFYSALKEKGYGGVIDLNDSVLEKFTWSPTIVFDDQFKNIASSSVADASHFSASHVAKSYTLASARKPVSSLKDTTKTLGKFAIASMVGVDAARRATNRQVENSYIERYKKEHPNSKLTDAEIRKMYVEALKDERKKQKG